MSSIEIQWGGPALADEVIFESYDGQVWTPFFTSTDPNENGCEQMPNCAYCNDVNYVDSFSTSTIGGGRFMSKFKLIWNGTYSSQRKPGCHDARRRQPDKVASLTCWSQCPCSSRQPRMVRHHPAVRMLSALPSAFWRLHILLTPLARRTAGAHALHRCAFRCGGRFLLRDVLESASKNAVGRAGPAVRRRQTWQLSLPRSQTALQGPG